MHSGLLLAAALRLLVAPATTDAGEPRADASLTARPPWLGSREGVLDTVLPPWTPLVVRGTAVSPWGRTYRFDSLPFPAGVESVGAEMLAGPVRLEASVGGNEVEWHGRAPRVALESDSAVELDCRAAGEGVIIRGRARIEYDGMVRSDFELVVDPSRPLTGPGLALDRLHIVIPFRAERATYLYHYPGAWGTTRNAGELPPEGFVGGFRPYIWLGDEARGLAWFSESDRNFAPADPDRVTEITPDRGIVWVRIRILDTPVLLRAGEKLDYTFGFQATPVRHNEQDVWDYRICHAGNYGIEEQAAGVGATLQYSAASLISAAEGTVEMWVRPHFDCNPPVAPDDPARGRYNRDLFLISAGATRVGFYWNVDDRGMRLYLKSETGEFPAIVGGPAPMRQGEWHHVAFSWGDRLRVYVDGRLTAEADYQGLLPADYEQARIELGGAVSQFDVDEIRISDVARDLTEVPVGPLSPDAHTRLLDHLDLDIVPDGQTRTVPAAGPSGGLPSTEGAFVDGRFGRAFALYEPGPPRTVLDRLAELGVRTIVFHEHWTDIQNYTSTTHGDELRRLVAACHARGIRLLLYFGYEMSDIAPEWDRYSDECLVYPRAGGYKRLPEQTAYIVCYRSHWQDFMAEGIARMMDEFDIDGVYLDGTANPWGCANRAHGCGYERQDGTVGPTYTFFATRDMMRRIYTIVKTRKPDGLVNVHQSTCMTIPTLAWATSYWDGEQLGGIEVGPWALEVLPLDSFRCEFMGHQWGVPAELLCYGQPYSYEQATAISLPHDVLVRGSLGGSLELESKLWHAMDDFGRREASWQPYWANEHLVTCEPAEVKVSLYVRHGRGCIAVVSNLGRRHCRADVRLRTAAMGLPSPTAATDVLSAETIPVRDGRVTLELDPLAFRVLWLRPAE